MATTYMLVQIGRLLKRKQILRDRKNLLELWMVISCIRCLEMIHYYYPCFLLSLLRHVSLLFHLPTLHTASICLSKNIRDKEILIWKFFLEQCLYTALSTHLHPYYLVERTSKATRFMVTTECIRKHILFVQTQMQWSSK